MDVVTPTIVIENVTPDLSSTAEELRSVTYSPLPPSASPQASEAVEDEESAFAKLVRTVRLVKQWARHSKQATNQREAFLERFKVGTGPNVDDSYAGEAREGGGDGEVEVRSRRRKRKVRFFKPSGKWLYRWLAVVTIAVLYNLFLVIVRQTFHQLQQDYLETWLVLDYLADAIYIADVLVQFWTSERIVWHASSIVFITLLLSLLPPQPSSSKGYW